MRYNLAVDRGNTAAKAALYDGAMLVDMRAADDAAEAVVRLLDIHPRAQVDAVIYSTVGQGGEEAMAFLRSYAPRVVSLRDDIDMPITIPEIYRPTLGGDRIAAAAGAYMLYGGSNILVVDSGTAVTYDVVSPDGVFVGGNIAPGIKMSLAAMHNHTALLPLVDVPESVDDSLLGVDTDSAMIKGVIYGIVGTIESFSERLGSDTKIVVTGGTSPLFMPLLRVEAIYRRNLVLDGLNFILNRAKSL